ncbi:Mitochondrial inner membrane translocase complexsubunit Tim44 [Penicillium lividum]|nr:Mitochondrial inner membrane translocase complexsubunit Tim44 [Penicillium lividum]
MISAKMSTAARAATIRSQAPILKAAQGSRAISYSALPAQTLKLSSSQRTTLQHSRLPVSQLVSPFAALPLTRSFHVANSLFQQQQQQKEEKKGEETKSESEGQGSKEEGEKDKSPWQVFRDTLQTEFKASKEWNESTKALASSAQEFSESEKIKRAREAYKAASEATTTRTGAALKSTGQVIGKSAAWTWNTPVVKGVRMGVNATGAGLEKATRPVRQTEAYKSVKEAIDDGSSSRYGGWIEKEERRKRREEMEAKSGKTHKVEQAVEDPNAGTNVTLHKDAAWKESWRTFRDSNPMMQKLFTVREVYDESENPLISTARSITDRIGGFFAENETARVVKKFREIDPNFQMEEFQRELREYMLPEVLDAYVKGDIETLKLWLSDAQFSVYAALAKQYTTAGLRSDGRVLDVRGVEVSNARLLDPGDIPVFVVTCRAQEVHVYRNVKTGKLAAGMEDKVQLVTYAIGMTRIPEEVSNPETRGWRLIELQKAARDYI